MQPMAALILIVFYTVFCTAQGFAGPRHGGHSAGQDSRRGKVSVRASKENNTAFAAPARPSRLEQKPSPGTRTLKAMEASSGYSTRRTGAASPSITSRSATARSFTPAQIPNGRLSRSAPSPAQASTQPMRLNQPRSFKADGQAVKGSAARAGTPAYPTRYALKNNGEARKHDNHSGGQDHPDGEQHHDGDQYHDGDQHHDGDHHDGDQDYECDSHGHDHHGSHDDDGDEWLALGVGVLAGAVTYAVLCPVVAPATETVVVQDTVTVQQPAYVYEKPSDTLIVTATILNVRSGPGQDFSIIGVLHQGDRLVVHGYGVSPEWLYVAVPSGGFGWVMAAFTTAVTPYECG